MRSFKQLYKDYLHTDKENKRLVECLTLFRHALLSCLQGFKIELFEADHVRKH